MKIKKTRKLVKDLRPYWLELNKLEMAFMRKVMRLERKMGRELGIEDIEFIGHCDYFGIGNVTRTMELVDMWEMERKHNGVG